MAFDPAPSSLFASWSEDGTNITVPIASITDLTAAEADGTTGDWRTVIGRILEHAQVYYAGLATADQPTKITLTKRRREGATGMIRRYEIEWYYDEDDISTTAE